MHSVIKNTSNIEQIKGFKVENKEENINLIGISKYFELLLGGSPRLEFELIDEKKQKSYKRIINVEIG